MANFRRIGLYLTDNHIVLAETSSKDLQKAVSSSIDTSFDSSQTSSFHVEMSDEIHIVSTFQRLLRENKIDAGSVAVSIPIKDVFLRSFVVPMMPSSELNNVVYYQAKKYVPFDLKLLDFIYQAIPFVEDKQKKLRIVFYAVRKQTIERYDRILKQIDCKPVVYEPSLVSLAKQLIARNQLRLDQKTVVVYIQGDYGQIIFYEKGVSFFVREFSMTVPDVHDPKAVADVLRANILREIRKSLEYYSRQFSQDKVKELLVLAPIPDQDLEKILTEELSVKVRTADPTVVLGLQKMVGMDIMCACGSCITKLPREFASFNFLDSTSDSQSKESLSRDWSGFAFQLLTWKTSDFFYAVQALVVCILILVGGGVYGQLKLQNIKKQGSVLDVQQGELINKSIEEINANISKNTKELNVFKKIVKDKSKMASLLIILNQSLPDGVWLESAGIALKSNETVVDIKGYAYSQVEGAQYQLVNDLLSQLKSNKNFSKSKFNLNSTQKQKTNGQEAVYFIISGT